MYMPVKTRRIYVIISLVAIVAAFVLECIPNSLVVGKGYFDEHNNPAYEIIKTSYWDPRPIAFGVFTPFLAFLLTIVCIVLFSIRVKKPNSLRAPSMAMPFFAAGASALYYIFSKCNGVFTGIAIAITMLLLFVSVYNSLITSAFKYDLTYAPYNTRWASRKDEPLPSVKTIYLAGGCFWGVERYFSQVKGVIATTVGYANGTKKNPSYEDLKKGLDDAAETVKVVYDENEISLAKLIELYLRIVDPYSKNKQGEDEGVQYRTGIYYSWPIEEEIVKTYFEDIKLTDHKIELLYLKKFYPAEEYHQQYLEKHPDGYCHVNMAVLHEDEKKPKEENK